MNSFQIPRISHICLYNILIHERILVNIDHSKSNLVYADKQLFPTIFEFGNGNPVIVETCKKTLEFMPNRIEAVIAAKGL